MIPKRHNFLNSVKVLDFSTHLPGPFATYLLQRMGAQITRVLHPTKPDPAIAFGKAYSDFLNRDKGNIKIDLKDSSQRTDLEKAVLETDVVLYSFRPSVCKKLGIDPESLWKIKKDLIICSMTGFPIGSKNQDRPGHDLNFIALSGMLSLTDKPRLPPVPLGDVTQAWDAALQVASAVASGSNEGVLLNPNIEDALDHAQGLFIEEFEQTGRVPKPGRLFSTGGTARYEVYELTDGKHLSVGALEEHYWQAFLDVIGLSDLDDSKVKPEEVKEKVQKALLSKSASRWEVEFEKTACCVEVILDYSERDF